MVVWNCLGLNGEEEEKKGFLDNYIKVNKKYFMSATLPSPHSR